MDPLVCATVHSNVPTQHGISSITFLPTIIETDPSLKGEENSELFLLQFLQT